jgi:Mrp family chromosome partitioning ATPase
LSGARSLPLSPSPALAALIVGAHGCAAASAVLALPGWGGAALATGLAALGLASAWSRALLRSPSSPRRLVLEAGKASVELASGESLTLQAGHVSRLLVTLAASGRVRRTLLITADMLDPNSFRALRVWALWGKLPGVAGKQLAA